MAITRQKKEEVLAKAKDAVSNAGSVVFVNFKGLSVADTTAMRKKLREEGISYSVAKKTLIGKALDDAKFAGERPEFPGELAMAYGADMLAPAREVHDFTKKYKEKLSIVGGVFEGAYKNAAEMSAIALIPSRQTLLAQFVMLINSPLQRMAVVTSEIAKKKEA